MRKERNAKRAAESAKSAARRALIIEQARIKAEAIAEEQAPAIQRLNGTAVPDIKRGGYRRADPLLRMHKADPRTITKQHLQAADKLSRDYEIGHEGASPPPIGRSRVDEEAPGGIERQFMALARYRAACDALGPSLRTPVQLAALHKWTLTRIGEHMGVRNEARVSGYLVAGLDRLCDHYWPDRGPSTIRPDPVVIDAAVTDIPQNRLGRKNNACAP